jgi:hypothetical protein
MTHSSSTKCKIMCSSVLYVYIPLHTSLSLPHIRHHSTNDVQGRGGICTSLCERSVQDYRAWFSSTPRMLYPQCPLDKSWLDYCVTTDAVGEKKTLASLGNRTLPVQSSNLQPIHYTNWANGLIWLKSLPFIQCKALLWRYVRLLLATNQPTMGLTASDRITNLARPTVLKGTSKCYICFFMGGIKIA